MASARNKWLFFLVLAVTAATAFYFSQNRLSTASLSDGLWEGTFDINDKSGYHFTALHVGDRAVGSSDDARVICRGRVSVEDKHYRSEMDMFFMTGAPLDKVTMEGTLSEPGRIEVEYKTHGAGDTGKLKLHPHKASGKKASLRSVAGPWILYRGFNILKLDINDTGVIKGGNTSGCAYDGKIQPIDSKYNAYDVTFVVTSCNEVNGTWTGMAYLSDGIAPDDTLNLYLFEEDWAMLLPVVRNDSTRLIDERKEWKN